MSGIEFYEIIEFEDPFVFIFISKGKKNIIKKVLFEQTSIGKIFNLALGDMDARTGRTNYESASRNGDMELVLRTVVEIIRIFTIRFPDTGVLVTGDQAYKTKTYRMGLLKYFREFREIYEIYGLIGVVTSKGIKLEAYLKNMQYDGIIVKRLKNNNNDIEN